ncbi:winged helix-turn-helix transcriptional regulator [Patescibacteria group bacterium]|nr:winged helix-turn-helix transcriptional regulator [Patescibacteria group bacterium]
MDTPTPLSTNPSEETQLPVVSVELDLPEAEDEIEADVRPKVKKTVTPTEDEVFQIEQLFGSRTRARLLGLFLENSDRAYYVREVARRVDAQLNSVRRELKNLVDIGVVLEVEAVVNEDDDEEVEKTEKRKYYKANLEFPIYEELKGVMKKVGVLMNRALLDELKKTKQLHLLVLTGRFTDNHEVPTDVLIIGTLSLAKVQEAVLAYEKEIGREVNYTFMPLEEFMYRRDVGDRFLNAILAGPRIILFQAPGV